MLKKLFHPIIWGFQVIIPHGVSYIDITPKGTPFCQKYIDLYIICRCQQHGVGNAHAQKSHVKAPNSPICEDTTACMMQIKLRKLCDVMTLSTVLLVLTSFSLLCKICSEEKADHLMRSCYTTDLSVTALVICSSL